MWASILRSIVARYLMKKLKTLLLVWLTKTKIYKFFLKRIIPYLRLSTYYSDMRGWRYHKGYKLLRPGDIIVTRDNLKLTSYIIGGEWAHAGICVSKDKVFECAEMTHSDFTKSTFADMCFEASDVAILRNPGWDSADVQAFINSCLDKENAKYDVQFRLGEEEFLYCSELVYDCAKDTKRPLKVKLDDLAHLGRKYVSPTGLWNSEDLEIVWRASDEIKPEVLR